MKIRQFVFELSWPYLWNFKIVFLPTLKVVIAVLMYLIESKYTTIVTSLQKEQTFQLSSLLSVSKSSMQNFYGGL